MVSIFSCSSRALTAAAGEVDCEGSSARAARANATRRPTRTARTKRFMYDLRVDDSAVSVPVSFYAFPRVFVHIDRGAAGFPAGALRPGDIDQAGGRRTTGPTARHN